MDAIYARQSVEREDSLSIEGQLERCRFEAGADPYREYVDRGFSGKNTSRPAFQQLIRDVQSGLIGKVIVYRLDRISRSILDFAQMMALFEQKKVEFLSSTEHFDTSTPMGRAMLSICIVFAQLERETIQRRVLDAYADRSRRGFYMGGRTPYGFSMSRTEIGGVRTSYYAPVPAELDQIRLLYERYADPRMTLGGLARALREEGIVHLRGSTWNATRLGEMLQNPIYCRADRAVFDFFREQGAEILNAEADFIGQNGCYLFKGQSPSKRSELRGTQLVLAPHEGAVPSDLWLTCRRKLLRNQQAASPKGAKNTWLTGRVKCAKCGYALTVAKSKSAAGRYFVCSGRAALGCCEGLPTLYADELEAVVQAQLFARLREFPVLSPPTAPAADDPAEALRRRAKQLEQELDTLADKAMQAGPALMTVLSRRAEQTAAKLADIQHMLTAGSDAPTPPAGALRGWLSRWDHLPTADQNVVLGAFVKVIRVGEHRLDITWKI